MEEKGLKPRLRKRVGGGGAVGWEKVGGRGCGVRWVTRGEGLWGGGGKAVGGGGGEGSCRPPGKGGSGVGEWGGGAVGWGGGKGRL